MVYVCVFLCVEGWVLGGCARFEETAERVLSRHPSPTPTHYRVRAQASVRECDSVCVFHIHARARLIEVWLVYVCTLARRLRCRGPL